MPKYSCLQAYCQSINLKMAIRAETCSSYLCNKQHISNHQIVVFDSCLIELQGHKNNRVSSSKIQFFWAVTPHRMAHGYRHFEWSKFLHLLGQYLALLLPADPKRRLTSHQWTWRRGQLKYDGTRAETRFRLSWKRTSPFKSAGGVSSVDYCQLRCAQQR